MLRRITQILILVVQILLLASCQSIMATIDAPVATAGKPSTTPIQSTANSSPLPNPGIPPIGSPTPAHFTQPTSTPLNPAVYHNSFADAFSADGQELAFTSSVVGLIHGDLSDGIRSYIYQTQSGAIQRISPEDKSTFGNARQMKAISLSADGRYLLYAERDTNSIEPAFDHFDHIYLRDLQTGQDESLDLTLLEKQLGGARVTPKSVSPDGCYLALSVYEDRTSIYLLELSTYKLVPVSVNPKNTTSESREPTFSPDGDFLAFVSTAGNLVPGGDTCLQVNPCADIFVYQITTGMIERISAQIQFTMGEPYPSLTISNKARWLAWTEVERSEYASRMVVRLYDRSTGNAELICAGAGQACTAGSPSISNDGRWLAFDSWHLGDSVGYHPSESNAQVYLLDLQTRKLTLVSATSNGVPGDGNSGIVFLQQEGHSDDVRISGDGRYVAFSSQAANLLPKGVEKSQCFAPNFGGAYPCYDLFIYDNQTGVTTWISKPG